MTITPELAQALVSLVKLTNVMANAADAGISKTTLAALLAEIEQTTTLAKDILNKTDESTSILR